MKGLDNRQNKSQILKKKRFLKARQPWYQQFIPRHKTGSYARQKIRGKRGG